MKKNLEILEYENKVTNTDPPKVFMRFKTNEGWMSCFDIEECGTLKGFKGKSACVETVTSVANKGTERERTFENIKKCLGEATEIPEEYEKEVEKPKPFRSNENGSMYASYVKDVFCMLFPVWKPNGKDITAEAAMLKSIELVKQAKEAFE